MGNSATTKTSIREIKLSNGDIYEGVHSQGIPNGTGRLNEKSLGIYYGEFSNGMKHGKGKLYYANGEFYNGDW